MKNFKTFLEESIYDKEEQLGYSIIYENKKLYYSFLPSRLFAGNPKIDDTCCICELDTFKKIKRN
jgi:hypothetical protein